MRLRPVSFEYKDEVVEEGGEAISQYGLIAEEVAEVAPGLVVYDDDGKPYRVRYRVLAPMLLNEVQRLRARVAELEARHGEGREVVK